MFPYTCNTVSKCMHLIHADYVPCLKITSFIALLNSIFPHLFFQARVNVACASQSTQWRHDRKSTFTSEPELQVWNDVFVIEVSPFYTNDTVLSEHFLVTMKYIAHVYEI